MLAQPDQFAPLAPICPLAPGPLDSLMHRRIAIPARPVSRLAVVTAALALSAPLLAAAPSQAAPVLTAPVAATVAPAIPMPMAPTTVTRYVTSSLANVRSGAGTSYSVVDSVAKDTKLTGTLTSSGWLKIGTDRYVGPAVLTATAPGDGGGSTSVVRYVSTSSANVRSGPSTSYGVVGSYARGKKVTGTIASNGWLKLGTGRFMSPTVLTSTAPTVTRYVDVSSANVRTGPSTSYDVVAKKSLGDKVVGTVHSSGDWVKMDSQRYISTTVLATTPPGDGGGDDGPTGNAIIDEAKKYVGIYYVYGGNTPAGFDCSGYTQYVFGQLGYTLPRTAAQQQDFASPVSTPQVGDLVFWGNPAYHVGIYAGDGYIYDSGKPGIPVQKRKMFSGVSSYGRIG